MSKPSDKFTWQVGDVEWLPPADATEEPDAEGPTEPDDKPRSPQNQPGAPPPKDR